MCAICLLLHYTRHQRRNRKNRLPLATGTVTEFVPPAVVTGLETVDHVVPVLSEGLASNTKFVADAAGHGIKTVAPERAMNKPGNEPQHVAWELNKFKLHPPMIAPWSAF